MEGLNPEKPVRGMWIDPKTLWKWLMIGGTLIGVMWQAANWVRDIKDEWAALRLQVATHTAAGADAVAEQKQTNAKLDVLIQLESKGRR